MAAPRRRARARGAQCRAEHYEPRRAAARGSRSVKTRAMLLLLGLLAFVLVGWGVGALWTAVVGQGDLEIVRALAAHRSPALTDLMRAITWAGSAFVLVPLALLCCGWFVHSGMSRQAIAVAVSLGGAMLIAGAVKLLVARPRPPVEHLQAVTGPSFPSGHAMQASAFWLSLALAMGGRGSTRLSTGMRVALASLIAVGVAASRVYLGVHYLSDVIAGLLLGGAWAFFAAACLYERCLYERVRRSSRSEPC